MVATTQFFKVNENRCKLRDPNMFCDIRYGLALKVSMDANSGTCLRVNDLQSNLYPYSTYGYYLIHALITVCRERLGLRSFE